MCGIVHKPPLSDGLEMRAMLQAWPHDSVVVEVEVGVEEQRQSMHILRIFLRGCGTRLVSSLPKVRRNEIRYLVRIASAILD